MDDLPWTTEEMAEVDRHRGPPPRFMRRLPVQVAITFQPIQAFENGVIRVSAVLA